MKNIIEQPYFDRSLMEGIKALDEFTEKYPDTPVYFVTKRMGNASPLFYKALICIYTGYWHALQGWNIEAKDVESWELIKGGKVKDFEGKGLKLAWTPEEYELIKDRSIKDIISEVNNMNSKKTRGPRNQAKTKLKALRVASGLAQLDVAVRAGLNLRTYQYYEQGSKPIEGAKLETLLKICLALNCKLDEIIEDQNLVEVIKEYQK